MNIYFMGEMAFVKLDKRWKGFMLCIGTRAEVEGQDENHLVELTYKAMHWSDYRHIEEAEGLVIH